MNLSWNLVSFQLLQITFGLERFFERFFKTELQVSELRLGPQKAEG